MALRSIEVMEVMTRRTIEVVTVGIVVVVVAVVVHRMRARAIALRGSSIRKHGGAAAHGSFWSRLTSSAHSIALAGLLEIFVRPVNLVKLVREGIVILRLWATSTGACRSGGSLMLPAILGRCRPLGVVVV